MLKFRFDTRVYRRSTTLFRYVSTDAAVRENVESKKFSSKLKSKLNYFLATGQIIANSKPHRLKNENQNVYSKSLTLEKSLNLLRAKYDSHQFVNEAGERIRLETLKPSDLKTDSEKSLTIFRNLINFKRISKKPIYTPIAYTLLGVNQNQLKDEFVVTKSVVNLLMRDQTTERAEYLARISGLNGQVAMNAILSWLLERGQIKEAFKNFQNRKKWNIPTNHYTYTILFDGIAKSQEWGKMPSDVCNKCIAIFEQQNITYKDSLKQKKPKSEIEDLKVQIEQFNACLNVLIKNFENDQLLAWNFFNRVLINVDTNSNEFKIIADCHTFTTMLNGARKYSLHQAETITSDRNMPLNDKTLKLLEIQAKLINTAEIILDKVIKAATPPTPPTKEQVNENQELLAQYRQKMRRQLLSIDPNFVSVFVSCMINNIGTGLDIHLGSHYMYVQRGLQYLRYWSPQVDEIFTFLESTGTVNDVTQATKNVKHNTDKRILSTLELSNRSDSLKYLLPQEVLQDQITKDKVNPNVIFPPPVFSKNKTRAIFNGKQKPLVDFTRPTYQETRALLLDQQYRNSRGKYGKKLPASSTASLKPKSQLINRFLLQLIVAGLIGQRKTNEFVKMVWYVLTKFGDIRISSGSDKLVKQTYYPLVNSEVLSSIVSGKDLTRGLLAKEDFPSVFNIANVDRDRVVSEYNSQVVDIQLIHTIFHKMNENFRKDGLSAIKVIVEIFSALVNPKTNPSGLLKSNDLTKDIVFSSFVTDLHYYNDFNYNSMTKEKKQLRIPNNTPRKSINHQQLQEFIPLLTKFMDALQVQMQRTRKPTKLILDNSDVSSYNKIIDRIYRSTWVDTTDEQKFEHHLQVIKSGILFYRPKVLIDFKDCIEYSSPIIHSIEYVYNIMKQDENLSEDHKPLFRNMKLLLQLKSRLQSDLDKLESIVSSIYKGIK